MILKTQILKLSPKWKILSICLHKLDTIDRQYLLAVVHSTVNLAEGLYVPKQKFHYL